MTDWITAIASLVAAIAAAYGIVQGLTTYHDSVRVNQLSALVDLEGSFQRNLPFLTRLEDDGAYASEIRPVLERSSADLDLSPEQLQVHAELESSIRFFYIFWVRVRLFKDSAALLAAYAYYLEVLNDRSEVRAYVQRYYPGLFQNLNAERARGTASRP